jgi:hypothetical protein
VVVENEAVLLSYKEVMFSNTLSQGLESDILPVFPIEEI